MLVVGAGEDTFFIYRRDSSGQFVEEFHRDQTSSLGTSHVDVSGQRVAQQGFFGDIRLYEPDGNETWSLGDTLSAPLPFETSSGLGNGVDIDGDKVLSLKSFSDASSKSFRQAAELWQQADRIRWLRAYVLADPHLAGDLSANLGNQGRAMALSGDSFWLGQSSSPWCVGTTESFFDDNGS